MTEAVLNHDPDTLNSGRGGPSGRDARFHGDSKLSPAAVAPRESWIRRTVQAAASLAQTNAQATFARGAIQLSKGMLERAHLPKGGRVFCQRGRVWITADGGGEDVVLSCGEFRCFRPGVWLLIEAIAKSEIIVEA